MDKFDPAKIKIGVVGLGYVGLPLAVAFADHWPVVGFDLNENRIGDLRDGKDETGELRAEDFADLNRIKFSSDVRDLADCNFFVVAVPTPVDENKIPDLSALEGACNAVGPLLNNNDIVVFESTVYPGVTEEFCAPILQRLSGLELDAVDSTSGGGCFHLGYSPERVNPGDKSRTLKDIIKITSGSTPEVARFIDAVYGVIIDAGTFPAASIQIAEAAKVIENIQRDVNIALINELSIIFGNLALDTEAVLQAAGTKWNFMPFKPGLVGGHCIGIDPYYLTYKAQSIGYEPKMILAGRDINEGMADFVLEKVKKLHALRSGAVESSGITLKALLLGATFKEDCPDIRNSKALELGASMQEQGLTVQFMDPIADVGSMPEDMRGRFVAKPQEGYFDNVLLLVPHKAFCEMGPQKIRKYLKPNGVFFDMKAAFDIEDSDGRL